MNKYLVKKEDRLIKWFIFILITLSNYSLSASAQDGNPQITDDLEQNQQKLSKEEFNENFSTKLDSNLTDLAKNGDPEEEIVVGLLIKTESNQYADKIKEETQGITEEIRNISNDIKKLYREIDEELGYSPEEIVRNFKARNESFINIYFESYRRVAIEKGLTPESMELNKRRIESY